MAHGRHILLLRGINVGGRHKLPMRDLVEIVAAAGCTDVRSYIQSGNVVFRASAALARQLPRRVGEEIAQRFGFEVPVVLRSRAELQKIVEGNPFVPSEVEAQNLAVGFLATRPTAARVRSLDPDRSLPDTFTIRGREIYLCCPNGAARSKLTNQYFDSRLATVSTMRNWKTTLKLLELATD